MTELKNLNSTLTISESGEIASLTNSLGREWIGKKVPLFSLRLIDDDNNRIDMTCADGMVSVEKDGDRIIVNSDNILNTGINCRAEIKANPENYEFRLKIQNPTTDVIEWFDYPGCVLKNDMADRGGEFKFLKTRHEGLEISDLSGYQHFTVDYPNKGFDGNYPGPTPMQYQAYYDGKQGLYVGAHDAEQNLKVVDAYHEDGDIRVENKLLPGLFDNSSYEYPYPVVIQCFEGNWADATEIYRSFAEKSGLLSAPKLRDNPDIPDWIQESPVVVIYPVRGDEDIGSMAPNMYYPYTNALPYLEKLSEKFTSKLLVLLCHWEGTAPWAPPYVWPPFGDKDNFLEFVRKLHENNQLVGVYCSGTAWTEESIVDPTYNTRELFEKGDFATIMATGPDQKLTRAYICNGNIRWGYDMCIHTERARDIVLNEVEKIIKEGKVDYIQYFDQNLGGIPSVCYSRSHGHPRTPGKWLVEDTKKLLSDVNGIIEANGKRGKVCVGCESAAAEGFVNYMPFNDARNYGGFESGQPVPAYDYVFHEYFLNFMGNCNTSYFFLDVAEYPEFIFYRTGYLFTCGNVLTVILKENGKLHWDWSSPWKLPDVDQEGYSSYIKSLNDWKKNGLKSALTYGRMQKAYPIECGVYEFVKRDGNKRSFASVTTTRWLCEDGDVQVLVNYSETPEKVSMRVGDDVKAVRIYYDAFSEKYEEVIPGNGVCAFTVSARNAIKALIVHF